MEATRELKQAVADYRGGRRDAFTPLYEESSKYIYTCIYGVMRGNENAQDAIGDIMQDTYVEISRSIGQLGNEDSFLAWAGRIATRKCYAWLKKNKKYVLLQEEDDTFENLADDENIIPEEVMQNREKQRLVRSIIDTQLTEMQKICIVSYYYNEQKQSEIARELGIPENTVKTNLSRAKAKIRDGVLDLEKRQGTRLYSVAPLLLFLFKEDVEACNVPYGITAGVSSAVSAAGAGSAASAAGAGGKTLIGKIAGASLKAKIAAGIVAAGVLSAAVGTAVYVAGSEKRDTWAPEEIFEEEDASDTSEAEEEVIPMEQVPLSDSEKEDLKVLAAMLTMNSYFFGEDMDRNEYPKGDVGRGVQMITILGADEAYEKYLPPVEIDEMNWTGSVSVEDMRFYLETVFGVQDADLSAYTQDDKVVCGLGGNIIETETSMEQADTLDGQVYEIRGTCSIMEADTESTYPYYLVVTRNEDSIFGFQVMSMQYREGEESIPDHINTELQSMEESETADILLNPEAHSAYYPSRVDYQNVYFALVDVDQDGEDEIFLGSAAELDFNDEPYWITIFNILKVDRNTGKVSDFDGDMVYQPLDTNSWHFYDTGVLMTRAEIGDVHTNFWNLLTGEFTDAALWVADDPDNKFESEGHSKIYRANGQDITGEEADSYYQSLISGNEIPIVWCEVNQENVEALITGGSVKAVSIPMPSGRYRATDDTELAFYNDSTVTVSEGNSNHVYEFTIDGAGNLVIDPSGEALEGTYNAQTEEIRIGALKFRKWK